jgi:predicted ATPase/DNA-binding SARP family transcriptional activator
LLSGKWQIRLLGTLELRLRDETITRFRTQKAAELLAYLALHLEQDHTRDALVELLWPESDPGRGSMRLRQELASLRRQLEPAGVAPGTVLEATRTIARLNPDAVETDVSRFRTLCARASRGESLETVVTLLRDALNAYRGELLPALASDWVVNERERLAGERVTALRDFARAMSETGDAEAAVDALRTATAQEPLDEILSRELMQALSRVGRLPAVKTEFRRITNTLQRELGVAPSSETREKAAALLETASGRPVRRLREPLSSAAPDIPKSPADARSDYSFPVPLTRFFGREEELADLSQRIQSGLAGRASRLITLTGPGGTGKTRLAIEAAARIREAGYSTCFVSLASVWSARHIPSAIGSALQLPDVGNEGILSAVARVLVSKPSLLVLDNFEQVAEEGGGIVAELLSLGAGFVCLVTSRQLLKVDGEVDLAISPLPLPDIASDERAAMGNPAVRLLLDRLRNVRPDFALRASNVEAVNRICLALEGLPLSLELAAGWGKVMTPAEMLRRARSSSEKLDLLVTRKSRTVHRHRSVRSALDGSYELLSDVDRRLFRRLSVFRGGFSLDSAAAVAWPESERGELLERLLSLAEASLVIPEQADFETRFRMLETLREYAWERLSREEAAEICSLHAAHFADLSRHAAESSHGPEEHRWLRLIDADYSNIRAALAWSGESHPATHERLLGCLGRFWQIRGLTREGMEWFRSGLGRPTVDPAVRARACIGAGRLALAIPDSDASEIYYRQALVVGNAEDSLQIIADATAGLALVAYIRRDYPLSLALQREALEGRASVGDDAGAVRSLFNIAVVLQSQGEFPEARARFADCLERSRRIGDEYSVGMALTGLAFIDRYSGRLKQAEELLRESEAQHLRLGNRQGLADVWHNLAVIAIERGEYDLAETLAERSLAGFREAGNLQMSLIVSGVIAMVALCRGDLADADERWRAMRAEGERQGDTGIVCGALHGLTRVALYRGNPTEALTLIETARRTWPAEEAGFHRTLWAPDHGLALARCGLPEARLELSSSLRYCEGLELRIHQARLLHALSELDAREGRVEESMELHWRAESISREIGYARPALEASGVVSVP